MANDPVLPPEEWTRLETTGEVRFPIRGGARRTPIGDLAIWNRGTVEVPREAIPALIAVANDILPHDHPAKIIRAHVALLRGIARVHALEGGDWPQDVIPLRSLADALESFMPPDTPIDDLP